MTAEAPAPPAPSIRQLLLMSVPALIIGVMSALSLEFVNWIAGLLHDVLWQYAPSALGISGNAPWWIFVILTATGIAVGLVVWLVPGHAGADSATTELTGPPPKLISLPGLVLAIVLSLAGGVSLGPENPIVAINSALAVALGARIAKAAPPAIIVAMAISGTVGALFGTPVAAALVFTGMVGGMKMGGSLWDRLFLPLVAAGAGSVTTVVLGGGFGAGYAATPYGTPHAIDLLTGSVVACAAAALAIAAIYAFPFVHRVFHSLRNPLLYITLGGIVLGLLGMLGGPLTLFKGLDQSEELLKNNGDYSAGQLTVLMVVKLAALVVAASAGFRGGRIFPAVFIGVAAGLLGHALIPALPMGLAVACGVLGLVLAVSRDGWIAIFVGVAMVGDVTVLPMLCIIVLPTWLIVTKAREMLITPADLAKEAPRSTRKAAGSVG